MLRGGAGERPSSRRRVDPRADGPGLGGVVRPPRRVGGDRARPHGARPPGGGRARRRIAGLELPGDRRQLRARPRPPRGRGALGRVRDHRPEDGRGAGGRAVRRVRRPGAARRLAAGRRAQRAHRHEAEVRPLRLGRRRDARARDLPPEGRRSQHGRRGAPAAPRQAARRRDEGVLARAPGRASRLVEVQRERVDAEALAARARGRPGRRGPGGRRSGRRSPRCGPSRGCGPRGAPRRRPRPAR